MNEIISSLEEIEEFIISITETDEYRNVEYLVSTIRKNYLYFLSGSRVKQFEIPFYLEPLVGIVTEKFNDSGIIEGRMLKYMLENDINNWIHYYAYTFIIPASQKEIPEFVKNLEGLFTLVLTGYILELFRERREDIKRIVDNEKLLYETNQYGLSIVNDVEFKRDYFVYNKKAYLYSSFTNTDVIDFMDTMPGFARVITDKVNSGDILLRLDERLALPVSQAISYSTLDFEKFYGPQFHFNESMLTKTKTITVHIDEQSLDKLLMVIKQDYDQKCNRKFLHIEIETLPYMDDKTNSSHCITTFLHAMYYPDDDCFTHIDCTKNQYAIADYLKKYSEEDANIAIDLYTEKDLHYKIWCIENGKYSRQIWYELMVVSLTAKYQILLNEMLE